MAFRRTLSIRTKLFNQQTFAPSSIFSYIHHQNDDTDNKSNKHSDAPRSYATFLTDRRFGANNNNMMNNGSFIARYMSTTVGDGADKIEYMTDVAAGVLTDGSTSSSISVDAVVSQAPAVSEVAVAAADSYFPVAALQYLIDGIHQYTGLPWWGSIAATTVLIRGLAVPLMINQLKATSKLTLMRPKLEEIKQEMENRGMSPTAVAEGQARMSKIFKEYGVTPWTPLKGILIQGPVFVSFFLGIQNMVDKVPSFKEGGAFWFTDLTTPDTFYVLPVLTALTFWITVESNMQEGLEGNPAGGTMKNVSRVFAVLTVPITLSFPKAIFCYWITSNLFSLVYGLVIKAPGVKKFLGVPIIPVTQSTTTQSAFSFSEAMKKYIQSQQKPSPSVAEPPKPASLPTYTTTKPSTTKIPTASVLSQRIRSLEKEVKGRKKSKKR